MEYWNYFKVSLLLFLTNIVCSDSEAFDEENDKVDLRRELDKITQDLLVKKDPFYHSYVFNSGVGNREELTVDWMKQDVSIAADQNVVRWQAVRSLDNVHLLGQRQSSVVLMTAPALLSTNRTLQFQEHSVSFESNVTSTSLFTRWNPKNILPEVIVVVAMDTAAADLIFYRIANGKLEYITQWARYKKVSCISAVSVGGKNQLIVIDKGSSVSIDVFEVMFTSDSVPKLDFRLVQSFAVTGDCRSAVVCRAGRQHYLVLPLPQSLVVYRYNSGYYQLHTELPLPRVTQVVCFNVALQTYLAVNGDAANVVRLTEEGEFVSELMPGLVSEWMVLPVVSYRSDVLLLSKATNLITGYVWAGANRGFNAVSLPNCDGCLDGDWSGAVSIPFQHQNSLLIPSGGNQSSLVMVGTSLNSNNPLLDKLMATIENMKKYQDEWGQIKSKVAELEKTLRFVVKKDGSNVITGKWTLGKLESPSLELNGTMFEPQNTTKALEETTVSDGLMQIETLEASVNNMIAEKDTLVRAVEEREKLAWGLDGFKGKVTFKGKLSVANLTVGQLNQENADHLLLNTFRKDKPRMIQHQVIVEAIKTEDITVQRVNNLTREDLKFADGDVEIRGNLTLDKPLTVEGEVELVEGGRVNGVDLSRELCKSLESCSVFPMASLNEEDVRSGSFSNNIDESPTASLSDRFWSKTIAGKNLTVVKVNGIDWKTLSENVVYKNVYQNISGDLTVKGKVTSEPAVWSDGYSTLRSSQSRASDNSMSASMVEESPFVKAPAPDNRKFEILDELPTTSTVVVTELEVDGTVTVLESEWGAEAADVVLSNVNPIVVNATKTFSSVSVANNAQVEGTVGGVVVADLFTRDTDQVFDGPTNLHGNTTVDNLSLTGSWNGKGLSDVSSEAEPVVVAAGTINVLESVNGVPVSEFIFAGDNGVTSIPNGTVEELTVTRDIVVNGKVCGVDLVDFDQRRLSLSKDQEITGNVVITEAKVTEGFLVNNLSVADVPYFAETEVQDQLHISELHVEGDVTTEGVNSYNLTEVAANAVWLDANNEIEGPLVFKDEVAFDTLEGQEMCNGVECDQWLNVDSVVFKHNSSVTFTGQKTFTQILNISEDLEVASINNHKTKDILTKTTEQDILGNLIINGDVKVEETMTAHGLVSNQNLTELGHRCSVSENTITCEGNAFFKENVLVDHFRTAGKVNEVDFLPYVKSVVRTDNPLPIKGLKKFMGKTNVEGLLEVDAVNGEKWDHFLSDSVSAVEPEQIDRDVTFSDMVIVDQLSVDHEMAVDTVNNVNISQWKSDAVYINESHALDREIVLESASSKGNVSVETLSGLSLEHDIVLLHSASSLPQLRVRGVTARDLEVTNKVNGNYLAQLEQNTFKTVGEQTLCSDLIVGDLVVDGNTDTMNLVNEQKLRDTVSLVANQTLHGKYEFECMQAQGSVDSSEMVSGINVTSWTQTGVLKNTRDQNITGVWRVNGSVEMRGAVAGKGRLANVELQQLTEHITSNVLNVHAEMKSNLTEACVEANARLASARESHTRLHHLDDTQTFSVEATLVTNFQSNASDFLAISEKGCITTIYKWNKSTGMFGSLLRVEFGYSLKNFIILNNEGITYVLTESSDNSVECRYNGKHLWIFTDDHFKHITNVNFFAGDLFQGEGNTLFVINSQGMFKYVLPYDISEGKAFFDATPFRWNITSDVPKVWSGAVQYQWLTNVYTASKCSGQMISVAVDPAGQFVAVASTEPSEVQRHADYIKVYRQDGRLFDKLPAQNVNQLQWLSVPSQTWLMALEQHSRLNMYQLLGPLVGFQLQMIIPLNATKVTSLALPFANKVNLQPFLIVQSSTSVKLVQAFVQGDPYLGKDLVCDFDQILTRVPRK